MSVQLIEVPPELVPDYKDLIRRLPFPKNQRFRDLTGSQHPHAKVLGFVGFLKQYSVWLIQCECGTQFLIRGNSIGQGGRTLSCGCLYAAKGKTLEHLAWRSIMKNPELVCKRWHEYGAFAADMGECTEDKRWVGRLDRFAMYSFKNCFWADRKQFLTTCPQNYFRRITVHGVVKLMSQWADIIGITRERMRQRVNKCLELGADPAEAVTTPKGEIMPCVLESHKVSA